MKNATLAQLFPGNPGKLTPWIFPDSKELAALHEANAAQEGKLGNSRWVVEVYGSTDFPLDPHRWWS